MKNIWFVNVCQRAKDVTQQTSGLGARAGRRGRPWGAVGRAPANVATDENGPDRRFWLQRGDRREVRVVRGGF